MPSRERMRGGRDANMNMNMQDAGIFVGQLQKEVFKSVISARMRQNHGAVNKNLDARFPSPKIGCLREIKRDVIFGLENVTSKFLFTARCFVAS